MRKFYKYTIISVMAIFVMTLTSCSVLNSVPFLNKNKTEEKPKIENSTEKKVEKKTEKEKKRQEKKADKDVNQEAVLPHDREHIAVKSELKTYTPEEIRNGVVKGDWAIETVNGKIAVGEKAPFIKFVPSEKRIYGNNGCNVINGSYNYNPADSTISFDNLAATMMLCNKEGITDMEINQALASVKYYTHEIKGNDYFLHFYNSYHKEVMTLMHQNFDFLNGTWLVKEINDTPVDIPDMKLVIDVDEGKLHGNTGCNILNGDLEIDMDAANSISFSAIATTRMACPDQINYETVLLVALEEASAAKPVSADIVLLFDSRHIQVLKLERTSDKTE